jgi:hypothetical protein
MRARSVPRWLPVLGAITGLAVLAERPDTIGGVVAEAASAATSIAVGWYAWKSHPRSARLERAAADRYKNCPPMSAMRM